MQDAVLLPSTVVTVMVVVPVKRGSMTPEEETVATEGSELVQMSSFSELLAGEIVAVKV